MIITANDIKLELDNMLEEEELAEEFLAVSSNLDDSRRELSRLLDDGYDDDDYQEWWEVAVSNLLEEVDWLEERFDFLLGRLGML